MLGSRETAPYDRVTGLTYVIAPSKEPLKATSPDTSYHHAHHTEASLLELGEIGRAIRTSRIQLVLNRDHNSGRKGYHRYFWRSHLPSQHIDRIGLLVFGAANAVPGKVLDFRTGQRRPIRESERERLFKSGELGMQSEFAVRKALARFTIETAVMNLSVAEIKKYQSIAWEEDANGSVNEILGTFLPVAFKPLYGRYKEAEARGFLSHGSPHNPAQLAGQYVYQEPDRFAMFYTKVEEAARQIA